MHIAGCEQSVQRVCAGSLALHRVLGSQPLTHPAMALESALCVNGHCHSCASPYALQLEEEVEIAQEQARSARALLGTRMSNESEAMAVVQQQLSALVSERDAATAQLARAQVGRVACTCAIMDVCVRVCVCVCA